MNFEPFFDETYLHNAHSILLAINHYSPSSFDRCKPESACDGANVTGVGNGSCFAPESCVDLSGKFLSLALHLKKEKICCGSIINQVYSYKYTSFQ